MVFKNFINKIIYNLKNKKIYKIEFANLIFVILINITATTIFELIRHLLPELINYHLCLNIDVDFLAIYICVSGLMLPLAILLIEKLNSKRDFIEVEAYLKNSKLFPILVYFCTNLIWMNIHKDQYYLLITNIISCILIIYMYYKSFKMLSDLKYERRITDETRSQLIMGDIDESFAFHNDLNAIDSYQELGIFIEKNNYFNFKNYKNIIIQEKNIVGLIKQYNFETIDKIANILKKANKLYISTGTVTNKRSEIKIRRNPNIVVILMSINQNIKLNETRTIIYYKKEYSDYIDEIKKIINGGRLYNASDLNVKFYIRENYKYLQNDCITAINNGSRILLSNALEEYLDYYKDYVEAIKKLNWSFLYNDIYKQTTSLNRVNTYEFFRQIVDDITDYLYIISEKNNCHLMLGLIGNIYKMILFSYKKTELLSIFYVSDLYFKINNKSYDMKDYFNIYGKIKTELFEFVNVVNYNITLENAQFSQDVLLIYNKILSSIMFDLSKHNYGYFLDFMQKTFYFIDILNDKLEMLNDSIKSDNDNDKIKESYEIVTQNYECNIFATLAYVVSKIDKDSADVNLIVEKCMKHYGNIEKLTTVLLNSIDKGNNDSTYTWDLMENFSYDGFHTVNTEEYLLHLYCIIINSQKMVDLPENYLLSTYSSQMIKEFEDIKNDQMVKEVEKLKNKIEENKKKLIRNSKISNVKVKKFETKFVEIYNRRSTLYNLFLATGNLLEEYNEKNDKNYLYTNCIINKTYFLDKLPYDEKVVYVDFEKSFVQAFISSETMNYLKLLEQTSETTEYNILEFLNNYQEKINDIVIFASPVVAHRLYNFGTVINLFPGKLGEEILKAPKYFKYKEYYIPIYSFRDMPKNFLYLYDKNHLGKMIKGSKKFNIKIKDFYNNEKLINKFMESKINNLTLENEEKRKYLLESVNIAIGEYIKFNTEDMKGYKIICK